MTLEQRQVIEAVAEYLSGSSVMAIDKEITSTFKLVQPCDGFVPCEDTIRKKFGAVYQVGVELAEEELKERKIADFKFCRVTDPSYEDATHIAVLDYNRPICYLHAWEKAWIWGFTTLSDLADAVLQVKRQLVEKVVEFSKGEIFVVMEGGLVHEIVNLPPNLKVTVIDYDIEDVEKERLQISPVDGELCVINTW